MTERKGDGPFDADRFHAELRASLEELPAKLENQVRRLEEIVRRFNSFDVISWVGVDNLLIDPNRYAEGAHPGSAAHIEYVSLLCLATPFNEGSQLFPTAAEFAEMRELLSSIFVRVIALRAGESLKRDKPADEMERLAYQMYTHELMVRVPGYAHHQERVLRGLFAQFDDELGRLTGLRVDEAIGAACSLKDLHQQKLQKRFQWAFDGYRSLERYVRARRKKRRALKPEGVPDELVELLLRVSDKDLRRLTRGLASSTAMGVAGEVLALSPADLVQHSGLEKQAVGSFFELFSIGFGDVSGEYRLPNPVHPLKRRPILRHEDKFLCPIPDQVLWAIQPAFEDALKRSKRAWHRYEQHRHGYVLRSAMELFHRIMPSSTFKSNLEYPDLGSGSQAELDALGRLDTALFLVEAKGGGLRPTARRGLRRSFKDQLEELLQRAHSQALRAKDHLRSEPVPQFTGRSDRSCLKVDRSSVSQVYLVSVMLEPLGHLTAAMDARSPFSAASDDPVWTVNLLDLMAIADCLEGYEPWLPHYINRRIRVLKQGFVKSADELDLFIYYLQRGLYFDRPADAGSASSMAEQDIDLAFIGTMTDVLDHYYWHQLGIRSKSSPRPVPKVSVDLLRFIERVNTSGLTGRLDVILRLLDLDEESQRKWTQFVSRVTKRYRRDRKAHNCSMAGPPGSDWGITYVLEKESAGALEPLRRYVSEQRKRQHVRTWIGVAECPRRGFWGIVRDPPELFVI